MLSLVALFYAAALTAESIGSLKGGATGMAFLTAQPSPGQVAVTGTWSPGKAKNNLVYFLACWSNTTPQVTTERVTVSADPWVGGTVSHATIATVEAGDTCRVLLETANGNGTIYFYGDVLFTSQ